MALKKKGFVAGFTFQLRVSKNWTTEIALLYVQKGSKTREHQPKPITDITISTCIILNPCFIAVPLQKTHL